MWNVRWLRGEKESLIYLLYWGHWADDLVCWLLLTVFTPSVLSYQERTTEKKHTRTLLEPQIPKIPDDSSGTITAKDCDPHGWGPKTSENWNELKLHIQSMEKFIIQAAMFTEIQHKHFDNDLLLIECSETTTTVRTNDTMKPFATNNHLFLLPVQTNVLK